MNYQELLHSAFVPSKIVPLVEKASQNDVPVLILGEQGTGRELIAKIIHHTGERKNCPFSKLDCKFLTEGSFRDQLSTILREVDEGGDPGTVYLKEVGFLEEGNQLNLLRLLEDGFHQNRTERRILLAPRFISSSSEDLEGKVAQGKFAEDLYDRLTTLSVRLPSLRDRRTEIAALARHVLTHHSESM
jgi:DNA-binding NtrC family response regulator